MKKSLFFFNLLRSLRDLFGAWRRVLDTLQNFSVACVNNLNHSHVIDLPMNNKNNLNANAWYSANFWIRLMWFELLNLEAQTLYPLLVLNSKWSNLFFLLSISILINLVIIHCRCGDYPAFHVGMVELHLPIHSCRPIGCHPTTHKLETAQLLRP